MRAVAVVVVRERAAVDEVHELGHALIAIGEQLRRRVGEVVVPARDARVDHGDADAGAGVAVILLHAAGADGHGSAVVVGPNRPVIVEARDRGARRELLHQPVRQVEHQRVDQVERLDRADAPQIALHVGGQRAARHERHDDARRPVAGGAIIRTLRELVVEAIVLDARAAHARLLVRSFAMVRLGERRRRYPAREGDNERRRYAFGPPDGLPSVEREAG